MTRFVLNTISCLVYNLTQYKNNFAHQHTNNFNEYTTMQYLL